MHVCLATRRARTKEEKSVFTANGLDKEVGQHPKTPTLDSREG